MEYLQGFLVDFGPLCLVNSPFPLKYQLVIFLVLPLGPNIGVRETIKEYGQEVIRVTVVTGPAQLEEVHILWLLTLPLQISPPVVADNTGRDANLLQIPDHGDSDFQPFGVIGSGNRHGPQGDLGKALAARVAC